MITLNKFGQSVDNYNKILNRPGRDIFLSVIDLTYNLRFFSLKTLIIEMDIIEPKSLHITFNSDEKRTSGQYLWHDVKP